MEQIEIEGTCLPHKTKTFADNVLNLNEYAYGLRLEIFSVTDHDCGWYEILTKPVNAVDAWETINQSIKNEFLFNKGKNIFCEFGQSHILNNDTFHSSEENLTRLKTTDEKMVCFLIKSIKPTFDGNIEIIGKPCGPYGHLIKEMLNHKPCPFMFGSRSIVNETTNILTFDCIPNIKDY